MEDEIFYNNAQNAFDNFPDNFNILEEQIDVEIQMQYFEFVNNNREKTDDINALENGDELFMAETSLERKKEILAMLSVNDNVKAYRTIEKFITLSEGFIKQWAIMSLQENRILLQSTLLDEKQIFISTGLGGKGKKLRYFVVFLNNTPNTTLSNTQQKLLKDELVFELEKNQGEFETINFIEEFSTACVMLPLKTDIKTVFKNIIDECNQYGNFLKPDLIITNVKIMSKEEIVSLLHKKGGN
ncbi:MAG: hypothetical protein LBV47_07160 [Bacteroidales bacterium]|jgi:hypothetical protein|nr:hypothetical protein [Bacteroidales bacterium]